MNALVDFIKQSQNKPIIEKVENLIGVFEKNQLDNKKININIFNFFRFFNPSTD